MLLKSLFFISLSCSITVASPPECVSGINLALGYFTFASARGETEGYGESHCSNSLYVNSVWAAATIYCINEDIAYGESYLQEQCAYYDLDFPSYESVSANLTEAFIMGLPIVKYSDISKAEVYNTSVLVAEPLARSGIRTLTVVDIFVFDYNLYGWIIMGLWGLVLVSGIFRRVLQFIFDGRQRQGVIYGEDIVKTTRTSKILTSLLHCVRTNLTLPATFGTYRQRLWWGCTLPTRLELLVLVVYYLLTIALCSVTYKIFDPNLYWTHKGQIWRYFSDRTGSLTYPNLPFLWLFAGRNNIFIWATGWKYSTFNLFHRHIARVTTILAIAHSVGYTILDLAVEGGDYSGDWKLLYWGMGAVATVSMSLMLPLSSILLRRYSYEIFLLIHIVLSFATLVALFYHTHFYGTRIWDVYLWPVVAVWCFDRFARIVRWIYCNYHVSFSKGLITTKATATYNDAANLIVLHIAPGANHLKPHPGQHYFIYQYNVWRGWENHPFSLASWKQASSAPNCGGLETLTVEPDIKVGRQSGNRSPPVTESLSSMTNPQDFTFYIRPSTGFTGRIQKQCLQSSEPVCLKMLLEGPYGYAFPAHTYDTLVLIAGGTGIAGVLPYLKMYQKESRTSRIRLIWTTKQVAMITDITQRELALDFKNGSLEKSFYVTGENAGPETRKHDLGLYIQYGRPNVKTLVSQEVRENGHARTAVISCGPPGMADETRDCVHSLLKQGFRNVEYVEESFGW